MRQDAFFLNKYLDPRDGEFPLTVSTLSWVEVLL